MTRVTTMLLVLHAGVGALWLGAMAYSLFVVQPRLGRMLGSPEPADTAGAAVTADPARVEDAQRELAQGNRWPVVGLIAVLWLTGFGLVALTRGEAGSGSGGDGGTGWWWGAVAVKAGLLAAATGLFWWVSWRGWPRRVFALPAELPGLQRRFRFVALAMFALVGAAFAIGVAAPVR